MLVNHANMKGFGLTPLFGDRSGYMPPQLKKQQHILSQIVNLTKSVVIFWVNW
jgi:hypothetical protein